MERPLCKSAYVRRSSHAGCRMFSGPPRDISGATLRRNLTMAATTKACTVVNAQIPSDSPGKPPNPIKNRVIEQYLVRPTRRVSSACSWMDRSVSSRSILTRQYSELSDVETIRICLCWICSELNLRGVSGYDPLPPIAAWPAIALVAVYGRRTALTTWPWCICSNASCHCSKGHTPPMMGRTSNWPLAIKAKTRSQIAQ